MGHDGLSPGARNPLDRLRRGRRIVMDVIGAAGPKVDREGLLAVGYDAGVDERVGDVRTPHRRRGPGVRLDGLPRDGDVPGEPGDHLHGPVAALGEHPRDVRGQPFVVGVEKVAEYVDRDSVDFCGELHAPDERDARRFDLPRRLLPSGDRVMVGQPEDVDSGAGRLHHELGGGRAAVGGRGVSVQIDHGRQHYAAFAPL